MSEHFLAPSLMGLTHGTMLTMNVSWIPRLFINKEPIFKFKRLIEVLLSLNRYLTTEKKHKNGRKHRINSTFSGTPYHSEKKTLRNYMRNYINGDESHFSTDVDSPSRIDVDKIE